MARRKARGNPDSVSVGFILKPRHLAEDNGFVVHGGFVSARDPLIHILFAEREEDGKRGFLVIRSQVEASGAKNAVEGEFIPEGWSRADVRARKEVAEWARLNPTEAECDARVRRALSRKKKKVKAPTWESPEDFPAMPNPYSDMRRLKIQEQIDLIDHMLLVTRRYGPGEIYADEHGPVAAQIRAWVAERADLVEELRKLGPLSYRKNPKSRSKSERAKERRLRRLKERAGTQSSTEHITEDPRQKGRFSEHGRRKPMYPEKREERRRSRQKGKGSTRREVPERVSPAKSGKPQKYDSVIIFENLPGGKRKRWTYRGEKMSGDLVEVTTQGGGAGRKHGFLVYRVMFETYSPGEEYPEIWSATFTEPDFSVEKVDEYYSGASSSFGVRKNPKSRKNWRAGPEEKHVGGGWKPRQPSARQKEAREEAKLAMKISHELGISLKEAWDIVRSEGAYALLSRGY